MDSLLNRNRRIIKQYFNISDAWFNAVDVLSNHYRIDPNDFDRVVPFIIDSINNFKPLVYHSLNDKEKQSLFVYVKTSAIDSFSSDGDDDDDDYNSDDDDGGSPLPI